jgi:hypothetical protein
VVVLRAEGSYYTIKRGSQQIVGAAATGIVFLGVTGSAVFGRGI